MVVISTELSCNGLNNYCTTHSYSYLFDAVNMCCLMIVFVVITKFTSIAIHEFVHVVLLHHW